MQQPKYYMVKCMTALVVEAEDEYEAIRKYKENYVEGGFAHSVQPVEKTTEDDSA